MVNSTRKGYPWLNSQDRGGTRYTVQFSVSRYNACIYMDNKAAEREKLFLTCLNLMHLYVVANFLIIFINVPKVSAANKN